MPRLTRDDYLVRQRHLREIWLNEPSLFSFLEGKEQRALHDYFAPSENFSREELIAHRSRATRDQPSVPSRAGKAYAHIVAVEQTIQAHDEAMKAGMATQAPRKNAKITSVTARAVLRPKPDYQMVARIIWDLAADQVGSEQDESPPRSDARHNAA